MRWLRNGAVKRVTKRTIERIIAETGALIENGQTTTLVDALKMHPAIRFIDEGELAEIANQGEETSWSTLLVAMVFKSVTYELSYDKTIFTAEVRDIIVKICLEYIDEIIARSNSMSLA